MRGDALCRRALILRCALAVVDEQAPGRFSLLRKRCDERRGIDAATEEYDAVGHPRELTSVNVEKRASQSGDGRPRDAQERVARGRARSYARAPNRHDRQASRLRTVSVASSGGARSPVFWERGTPPTPSHGPRAAAKLAPFPVELFLCAGRIQKWHLRLA
jgi:hypothetical protein